MFVRPTIKFFHCWNKSFIDLSKFLPQILSQLCCAAQLCVYFVSLFEHRCIDIVFFCILSLPFSFCAHLLLQLHFGRNRVRNTFFVIPLINYQLIIPFFKLIWLRELTPDFCWLTSVWYILDITLSVAYFFLNLLNNILNFLLNYIGRV